ncbi:MAG: chemotaxis protein CheA, partial [Candidatus Riflemargulisbacteria bacterium]
MDLELDLNDFIVEVEEQLRNLNDGLLDLEKNTKDADIINDIFRSAHTIKGAAGMFFFVKMMKLTHSMENVFDQIREGKLSLTPEHVDSLFSVLDTLNLLMDEVPSGQFNTDTTKAHELLDKINNNSGEDKKKKKKIVKKGEPDVEAIEAVLESEVSKKGDYKKIGDFFGRPLKPEELEAYYFATEGSYSLFLAHAKISEEAPMPSIASFMVISKIRESGIVIALEPSEEVLNEEELFEFNVLFATTDSKEVLETEIVMPDLEKIEIKALDFLALSQDEKKQETIKPEEKVDELVEENEEEEHREEEHHEQEAQHVDEDESQEKGKTKEHGEKTQTVRVDNAKLDYMLNMAGELVISRAGVIQTALDIEKAIGRTKEVAKLKDTIGQLMRITTQIQEGIMQLRMMPISGVFNKYPRVVRDLSRKVNKEVELVIEGKETELDKSVVEKITDPLMHILRNAVDHGIETPEVRKKAGKPEKGTVFLRAYHRGSSIIIEVEDDGKGINPTVIKKKAIEKGVISEAEALTMSEKEIIELVFAPGFSTAEQVSDLSGRGVGMDVVKRNIEGLRGVVEITTVVGKGSIFSIKLPLTLAIIPALLTYVNTTLYAIPLVNIIEI